MPLNYASVWDCWQPDTADAVSFLGTSIMMRKMYDRRSQESVSLFVCLSPGEDGWPFTLRASGNSHNSAATRGAYHSSPSHGLSSETSRLARVGFWSSEVRIAIQYVEGLCHINRGSVSDISIVRLDLKADLHSIMSAFSHQLEDSINNILFV